MNLRSVFLSNLRVYLLDFIVYVLTWVHKHLLLLWLIYFLFIRHKFKHRRRVQQFLSNYFLFQRVLLTGCQLVSWLALAFYRFIILNRNLNWKILIGSLEIIALFSFFWSKLALFGRWLFWDYFWFLSLFLSRLKSSLVILSLFLFGKRNIFGTFIWL